MSCLCVFSGLFDLSKGQKIWSRLLRAVCVEDILLELLSKDLKAAEWTNDFSAEVWKSKMTYNQGSLHCSLH